MKGACNYMNSPVSHYRTKNDGSRGIHGVMGCLRQIGLHGADMSEKFTPVFGEECAVIPGRDPTRSKVESLIIIYKYSRYENSHSTTSGRPVASQKASFARSASFSLCIRRGRAPAQEVPDRLLVSKMGERR